MTLPASFVEPSDEERKTLVNLAKKAIEVLGRERE